MKDGERSNTVEATDAEVNFERRALVEGGRTYTVFPDGSYTSCVPRGATGIV